TLVVDVSPLRITNNSVTDIAVTPSGNLAIGAVTLDTENELLRIPVLAGGTNGTIRVEGIRVAVAGTGIRSANAKLYWEGGGLNFLSGTRPLIISSVQSGLAADPITDRFLIINGIVVDNTSTLSLREGYASAFSSAGGGFGQTVSTRVRIHV